MAMPVIMGAKTDAERFPGAVETLSIEAMMQDRKALQSGTSHFLGQNFAKASGITFTDRDETVQHGWTTSWGVSTRLIGGLIMTHADDDGLVLPPKLAPAHVVIIPITFKADDPQKIDDYCDGLASDLRKLTYGGRSIEVEVDRREMRGGDKVWGWIKKGVPIRLEVGPRDMAADSVFMARRDKGHKEKESVKRGDFVDRVVGILEEMQANLLERAKKFRAEHTHIIHSREEFEAFFVAQSVKEDEATPIHGGFALAHWCGDSEVEEQVNNDLAVTIRCIPNAGQIEGGDEPGTCIFTGKPSKQRVVWAKSY